MRLCVCIKCRDIYGSCDLFQPYELFYSTLNKVSLRSDSENMIEENEDVEIDENDEDFLICDTYCAVAAGIYSSDTFWFFKINVISVASDFRTDQYNHVHTGQKYYERFFLEEQYSNSKEKFFTIVRKNFSNKIFSL